MLSEMMPLSRTPRVSVLRERRMSSGASTRSSRSLQQTSSPVTSAELTSRRAAGDLASP